MNHTYYGRVDAKINSIGNQMVGCSNDCKGIACMQSKGILPRCLYFQTDGREAKSNVIVVVGMNPGTSKQTERDIYINAKDKYEATVEYLKSRLLRERYYSRINEFLRGCKFDGPILWTEIVKCESEVLNKSKVPIPIFTIRNCVNEYLDKEIETLPKNAIILAVGRRNFELLSILYRSRPVIGMPHPSGNFSQKLFLNLFAAGGIRKRIASKVYKAITNDDSYWAE